MTNYALPKYKGSASFSAARVRFELAGDRGEKARDLKRLKAKQEFIACSQREAIRIAGERKKRRKFAHSPQVDAGEFNPLQTITKV